MEDRIYDDERNREETENIASTCSTIVPDDPLAYSDMEYGSIEALDEIYNEALYVYDDENLVQDYEPEAGSSTSKKRRSDTVLIDPRAADHSSQAYLTLRGTFYKRKFVGETSGSQVASEIVSGNTVEELLRAMWNIVKLFLCREIVFMDGSEMQQPTWADGNPCFEDMHKFIIMQDQAQKRWVTIDKIDSKLLVNWKSKDIKIHIHMYSNSVSCKSLWDLVDKQLMRPQQADRAGAPNNQTLTTLANTLHAKHGMQFSGHSSSWRLWANYIHSCPAHEQERLPPSCLLKFFVSAPISAEVKVDAVRSGLSVANTINDGLTKLGSEVEDMIGLGQRLKQRIEGMQARLTINSSLVTAMQDSLQPEENELSEMLRANVSDMLDFDHQ